MPDPKPRRHQSPAYPSIDLQTAIAKAQIFYTKQNRNAITVPVATQTLDYSSTNSEGRRVVSALVSFGLLDEETINTARHVKISQRAINILRHNDQLAACLPFLREAAVRPPIYAAMVNRWPDALPSDLAITQFLKDEKGYNPNTTAGLILDFRATYELAALGSRAPLVEQEAEETPLAAATTPEAQTAPTDPPQQAEEAPEPTEPAEVPPVGQSKPKDQVKQETQKYIFPLTVGRQVFIRIPLELSAQDKEGFKQACAMMYTALGIE